MLVIAQNVDKPIIFDKRTIFMDALHIKKIISNFLYVCLHHWRDIAPLSYFIYMSLSLLTYEAA